MLNNNYITFDNKTMKELLDKQIFGVHKTEHGSYCVAELYDEYSECLLTSDKCKDISDYFLKLSEVIKDEECKKVRKQIEDFYIAVHKHKKMWMWLAIQTLRQKKKAHKLDYLCLVNDTRLVHDCYCCDYVSKSYNIFPYSMCDCPCPINWGTTSHNGHLSCSDSLYGEWFDTDEDDYERAALLAYKISKLPVNDDLIMNEK